MVPASVRPATKSRRALPEARHRLLPHIRADPADLEAHSRGPPSAHAHAK